MVEKKLTKKQNQEINFYKKYYKLKPTQKDIEEFIEATVYGSIKLSVYDRNPNCLFVCKRKIEMTSKMWIKDMQEGILFPEELEEDNDDIYWQRVVKSIIKKAFPFREMVKSR